GGLASWSPNQRTATAAAARRQRSRPPVASPPTVWAARSPTSGCASTTRVSGPSGPPARFRWRPATPTCMASPATPLLPSTAAPISWSSSVPPTLSRRRVGTVLARPRLGRPLTLPTLRIRTQIILPFLLLMLILGVIGTYLTTSLVATSLENRIADQLVHSQDAALDAAVKLQGRQVAAIRLIANTEGIDQAVRAGDAAALRRLIVPLEVNNRLGTVMIFDPRGKTILEISQPDATNPGGLVFGSGTDLSNEPVVRPVLRGDYDALGDKYIGYTGSPPSALSAAGPVLLGDQVVGGVLVQTPLAGVLSVMQAGMQSAIQMTALFAGVVLILLLIGYLLALRLTRPIEALVSGTQAVARGDLTKRLEVRRKDELGELATAFNTMTQDLQERT